jgi:hypothetical protein
MVTTARCAMRSSLHPSLPKVGVLQWVVKNKLRVALGRPIPFDKYIDYGDCNKKQSAEHRESGIGQSPEKTQSKTDEHYTFIGDYFND